MPSVGLTAKAATPQISCPRGNPRLPAGKHPCRGAGLAIATQSRGVECAADHQRQLWRRQRLVWGAVGVTGVAHREAPRRARRVPGWHLQTPPHRCWPLKVSRIKVEWLVHVCICLILTSHKVCCALAGLLDDDVNSGVAAGGEQQRPEKIPAYFGSSPSASPPQKDNLQRPKCAPAIHLLTMMIVCCTWAERDGACTFTIADCCGG